MHKVRSCSAVHAAVGFVLQISFVALALAFLGDMSFHDYNFYQLKLSFAYITKVDVNMHSFAFMLVCSSTSGVVGWCDGPGSTFSAGASYNLRIVGQGSVALAVGAGGGCLDIFTLLCLFSALSPSLWETARYRLKYCLKGR